MAGTLCDCWRQPRLPLPLWPQSPGRTVAVGHLGQYHRSISLDRGFHALFLVCRGFRQLQSDIRILGRGYWVHGLAMAFRGNCLAWR